MSHYRGNQWECVKCSTGTQVDEVNLVCTHRCCCCCCCVCGCRPPQMWRRAAACCGAVHSGTRSPLHPESGPEPGKASGMPPTHTCPETEWARTRAPAAAPHTQGGEGGHTDVGHGATSRRAGPPGLNTHNTPEREREILTVLFYMLMCVINSNRIITYQIYCPLKWVSFVVVPIAHEVVSISHCGRGCALIYAPI